LQQPRAAITGREYADLAVGQLSMSKEPSEARPHQPRWRRWSREIAITAGFAGVLLSAKSSLADHYSVPSGSMLPTVEIGDRIVVNKASYGLRVPFTHQAIAEFAGPSRGDVVVLDDPESDKTLLKRVVAVPGDRVAVRNGQLELGGVQVPIEHRSDGDYELLGGGEHLIDLSHGGGPDLEETTIPDGHYLMMGDNRGDSRDGRYFGLVERGAILGRAARVYWRGGPAWKPL
jgi:signal peptidase I